MIGRRSSPGVVAMRRRAVELRVAGRTLAEIGQACGLLIAADAADGVRWGWPGERPVLVGAR